MWKLEFWSDKVDVVKPIEAETKEENNPIFEKVKVEWLWEKSYNQFIKAIENKKSTDEKSYNKIMWLFSDNELIWDIKDYISDEWYPITQNWINELLENFWVDWISRSHVVRGNASFLNSNIV